MHEKEPQEPPEHTSEHVSLKISWGRAPRPPLTQFIFAGPHFLYWPWAPPILSAALAQALPTRALQVMES